MTKLGLAMTAAIALFPAAAIPQTAPPPSPPAQTATGPSVPVLTATVVRRYPHDRTAFTEGLVWHDGGLFESIGLEGRSEVRRVDLASGRVIRRAPIPASQFGEGLAAHGGQLVSLTWHDGIAHRWDATSLKPMGTARYRGEGWGLTADAASLIMSDGSATLKTYDPASFAERRRIEVTINGRPVTQVNELEWVDGAILANIWHAPFLIRIDPATGHVTAVIDLRPIVAEVKATDPEAVANGIAWDAKRERLFVTGKLWPTLFEITLAPAT